MLTFIVCAQNSDTPASIKASWPALVNTLTSVCLQRTGDFQVICVCGKILPVTHHQKLIHEYTIFVEHKVSDTESTFLYLGKDLSLCTKRLTGLLHLSEDAAGHVMFVNAGEFVGNDIARFTNMHPDLSGWKMDHAYEMLEKKIRPADNTNLELNSGHIFNVSCLAPHLPETKQANPDIKDIGKETDPLFLQMLTGQAHHIDVFCQQNHLSIEPFPCRSLVRPLVEQKSSKNKWQPITRQQKRYFGILWPKVFSIGFQKTGTTSINRLLREMGYSPIGPYKVYDPDFVECLKKHDLTDLRSVSDCYDAFEDNPWPVFYRELDAWHPGSKFILTVRDEMSWVKSVLNHFGSPGYPPSPFRKLLYGHALPTGHEKEYIARYRKHIRDVKDYFANRPRDLLVVDLSQKDALARICRFLDVSPKKYSLPHENSRVTKPAKIHTLRKQMHRVKTLSSVHPLSVFRAARFDAPPIVIGGCARSGTSLLLSVLSCHEEIHTIGKETMAFYPQTHPLFEIPENQSSWDVEKLSQTVPMQTKRIYKWIFTHPVHPKARRWCEKTPKNVLSYDRIAQYFDNRVKIINMVRDGRDVVTSVHPDRTHEYFVHPLRWVCDVNLGKEAQKHPWVMTVRYEDLVLDYFRTVETICHFLEITPSKNFADYPAKATVKESNGWFGPARQIFPDSIGKWKKKKHEPVVSRLMQTPDAIELLAHYGYE